MEKMLISKTGYLLLLLFSGTTLVYSQMDVNLGPISYKKQPSLTILDSESGPQDQDVLNAHGSIQEDIRKLGEMMDSEIDKRLEGMPHTFTHLPKESQMQVIPIVSSFLDSSESDERQNPLLDLVKFFDNSMPSDFNRFKPIIPKIGNKNMLPTLEERGESEEPLRVLAVITVDDDDEMLSRKDVEDMTRNVTANVEMEASLVERFVNSFVDAMKEMMDVVRNSTSILASSNGDINHDQKVNIEIEDHGKIYEIPPYAHIERNNPNMVNITWKSDMENMNNSLYMNVSKDLDGSIIFHQIRLRMFDDKGVQEYTKEDPIYLKNNKNNTEIILADGVELKFPHSDSLDVVVVEKKGKFSLHWMAVSIALLGLIVAALVMILSYILHNKNRYYARKDSMSKEPIA